MLSGVVANGKGKASSKTVEAPETETGRKADFIYMEALAKNSAGIDDSYFELLRAAYELDPSETSVAQNLGYYYMALGRNDSVMARKGYNMIRRHFDLHPDDYYGAIFYGMINNSLGNVDESIRVWTIVDSLNPDKPDVAVKLVEALQDKRTPESLRKSLDVLQRIERAEGKDIGLTSHKIRAMLALGDTTSTIAEVNDLMTSSPRNIQYQLYAGDVFMAMRQPERALEYYNLACATDSTDGFAYYKRAQYYLQQGDSVGYGREVNRALLQENLDVDAKVELLRDYVGKLYGDSLQRPQIKNLFETLLIQQPHEAQFRDLYSSYLIVTNDMRGAAEQQEYAVDADPSNASRWRSIMGIYGQLDDNKAAIATGKRALEFLPDDQVINLLMGANYQQIKEYDTAMGYYRKAVAETPDEETSTKSQLLASIGDIYYAKQMPDTAFIYYREAVALDPDNLLALNNFAYYLAENDQDLDTAERYSAICVRANSENDTAIDTYAWIFFKKKDYVKAKEWIDKAIELEADAPQADVLNHAGDIYFMNREVSKAVDFWEKALKLDPTNQQLKKKIRQRNLFVD
jgi:tetratricopeptide (TPR) repeat protein